MILFVVTIAIHIQNNCFGSWCTLSDVIINVPAMTASTHREVILHYKAKALISKTAFLILFDLFAKNWFR